jgi:hypothetical protein
MDCDSKEVAVCYWGRQHAIQDLLSQSNKSWSLLFLEFLNIYGLSTLLLDQTDHCIIGVLLLCEEDIENGVQWCGSHTSTKLLLC